MTPLTLPARRGAGLPIYTLLLMVAVLALASCQPSRELAENQRQERSRTASAAKAKAHQEPLFPGLRPKRNRERDLAHRDVKRTPPKTAPTSAPRAKSSRDRRPAEVGPALKGEERLRAEIESYAEGFIGRPYQYGARGPSSFDCSGFTSYVLKQFDISLLTSSMSQAKQGRSVDTRNAKPGDLVYFANSDGRVNHVGIVVANGDDGLEVVHASTSRGVVRDNVTNSDYWAPRLAGVRCVVECKVGLVASY